MFRSSSVLLMTFKAAVDRFILKKLCSNHEKTKTTFTKPGTVCEGGLSIYCGFHSCWCFYAFFFGFFWYDSFVFIYLLIFFLFRHQRMCSWDTQMQPRCVLQQYQRFIQLYMQKWIHGKWTRM